MRYTEGVVIMDWTGKIMTNRSMKTTGLLSFITSMKNYSRFLVTETNQTHLLYTEYTFNGEEIIISKTGNKLLESSKIEDGGIINVISLNDTWGILYQNTKYFLYVIPTEFTHLPQISWKKGVG